MQLLDENALESSSVVANCRMNRERVAVGTNSYEEELRCDPIDFLMRRLEVQGAAAWLDLCCGRGRALIDAARHFVSGGITGVTLRGVDLVDVLDAIPETAPFLCLESSSLHTWSSKQEYDLITCVHGMHYVGDKLGLIERAASWLAADGKFLANLDLANLRRADGRALGRHVTKQLRASGASYESRHHLISCDGPTQLSFGCRFIGADDTVGSNYSGEHAADSYYEVGS